MVEKNPTPTQLIGEVNRIADELSSASSNATNALSVANSASSNASSALTTANNANTIANSANLTAQDALTKANTASSNANTALQNSTSALNTANSAIEKAEDAISQVTEGTGTKVYSNNVLLSTFDADTKADANDVPTALSQLTSDSTHRLVTDSEKTTWNNKSNFSGSYNDLTNKPTIPTALSQLSGDSTHRVVSDTQISNWNSKISESDLDYKTYVLNYDQFISDDTEKYPLFNIAKGVEIYNEFQNGKNVILKNVSDKTYLWSVDYAYKNGNEYEIIVAGKIKYNFVSPNSNTSYPDFTILQYANKDLSNVTYPSNTAGSTKTGSADVVVETYISSDGKTWYRKWKSGWKECGGNYTTGSNANGATITFPLSFSTANYNLVVSTKGVSANNTVLVVKVVGYTTNSFNSSAVYTGAYAAAPASYYACGY